MDSRDSSSTDTDEESNYYRAPESSLDPTDDTAKFYATGPVKFVLMDVATLGLYSIYWSYKNWHFVRERDQPNVIPFLCAIFIPLTFYWLMKSLASSVESRVLSSPSSRVLLAVLLLLLTATSALPDPYWLVSVFTFVPMMPTVVALWSTAERTPSAAHRVPAFHWSNTFAYLFGIPVFLVATVSMTSLIPSTAVISGDQMSASDIAYLREKGILGEEEEIEHFYSTALLSIADDGQFYSSEYVTSYFVDPDNGELYLSYAAYPEIKDIDVAWAATFVEDTIVTITTFEEETFELWLSSEAGGDHVFVDGMKALWDKKQDPP